MIYQDSRRSDKRLWDVRECSPFVGFVSLSHCAGVHDAMMQVSLGENEI